MGHETLWCAEGHKTKKWYVVDADDKQIALASLGSSPQILDSELYYELSINPLFKGIAPEKPNRTCKYGHNDWYFSDHYRCRACSAARYQKNKKKIKARYRRKKLAAKKEKHV